MIARLRFGIDRVVDHIDGDSGRRSPEHCAERAGSPSRAPASSRPRKPGTARAAAVASPDYRNRR